MTPAIPDEALQANKTLWCVHIKGPDDIISVPDHLSAVRMANTFNAWWLDLITKTPITDNHPRMWAEPVEWPYSEGHGEDVTDPNNEYQWLRALTAAAPFLQGVKVKALEWHGPDSSGEHHALNGLWGYIIRCGNGNGYWLTEIGQYYPTPEAAKAAAQADYEARVLSAIEAVPSPRAQALEEEEFAIDKLRFRAFHTNSDADRQAYFDAVSKWFQDRHYRRMDAETALSSQPVADTRPTGGSDADA